MWKSAFPEYAAKMDRKHLKGFITNMMSSKFLRSCEIDTTEINNNRSFLMGCAMAFVFLYHAYCIMWGYLYVFKLFSYLFVGVDMFMLISALGCSYSLDRNGVILFYKKRLKRVAPLYILFAVVQTLVLELFMNESFSLYDWFCNLTTLSYWGVGGYLIDWYIASILVLWLITPCLKALAERMGGVIVISICIVGVVMKVYEMEWYYNCLFARIPIYLTGIYIYKHGRIQALWFLPISVMLALLGANGYLIISMFAPFIMKFLIYVKELFHMGNFIKVMSFLGRYSLEIYFSNCIALVLFKYYCDQHIMSKIYCLLGYFLLNSLLAAFFIIANKCIRK